MQGVRMTCLRGIAAQVIRTPGALRRAGRAGAGLCGVRQMPHLPKCTKPGIASRLQSTCSQYPWHIATRNAHQNFHPNDRPQEGHPNG